MFLEAWDYKAISSELYNVLIVIVWVMMLCGLEVLKTSTLQ
jgi:hypothetical protein